MRLAEHCCFTIDNSDVQVHGRHAVLHYFRCPNQTVANISHAFWYDSTLSSLTDDM